MAATGAGEQLPWLHPSFAHLFVARYAKELTGGHASTPLARLHTAIRQRESVMHSPIHGWAPPTAADASILATAEEQDVVDILLHMSANASSAARRIKSDMMPS
jgi:hypothetical protein